MKITIVNRRNVYPVTFRAEKPFALIQFTDPEYDFGKYSPDGCILSMKFKVHDIDVQTPNEVCFDYNAAKYIITKLIPKKDELKEIICQCDAGISRSSGCAAALSLILTGSDRAIFHAKQYVPNRKIYRTILEAWQDYEDEQKSSKEELNGYFSIV